MTEESMVTWICRMLLPLQPDPRASAYPLMESWTPTALISLAYAVGAYAWRAEILKRPRSPKTGQSDRSNSWDLVKCLMVFYNVAMVFYSAYMTIGLSVTVIDLGYGLGCEEQPDPNDRSTDMLLHIGYLFYFSKFVEMLDTVFFLWRGKVDQVSFLHVFHHATMPPSIWWGIKYAPGGIVYMFIVANSFIHVIMYTYYGLAAAGLYKYLWWKNYLTMGQMIQFIILIVHQGQIFVRSTPCNYPKVFPAAIIFYAAIFFVLFANFYIKAYWRKQRPPKHIQLESKTDKSANGETKNLKKIINGNSLNGSVSNGHLSSNGNLRERNRAR